VRRRLFTIFAVGALLVSSGAAVAGGSTSASGPKAAAKVRAAKPVRIALPILYNQNNDDAGVGISSQNFEADLDIYDDAGADDFVVPAGQRWLVQGVLVTGVYYNGIGPADSETVTFYRDVGGLPGPVVSTQTVVGTDTSGSFLMRLTTPARLRNGTYWVSVVANMNFTPNGQWGWETRNTQANSGAAWQNPGDGFATGCTTWANMVGCIGPLGEGPDFMFAIFGRTA
jgi:hypothetical protein